MQEAVLLQPVCMKNTATDHSHHKHHLIARSCDGHKLFKYLANRV